MTFTTELEDISSKWPCPSCNQKRILPTATTTDGYYAKRFMFTGAERLSAMKAIADPAQEVKHYQCLHCGYRFSENENQKKLREKNAKDEKGDQPWTVGTILLFLMLGTILMIRLAEPNGGGGGQDLFPLDESIEDIQPDIEPEEDDEEEQDAEAEEGFVITG